MRPATRGFFYARSRPTRVIVLLGGSDFWSNGIDLNMIEASADPAAEFWRNINAINDLTFEILNTMSHFVIAGLRGNGGAGGAMLALAADRVYARSGIVINPHYRSMGDLYGSEYWTYTLPRRVGRTKALELTHSCQPIGTRTAKEIGFLDDAFGEDPEAFEAQLKERAKRLARNPGLRLLLRKKHDTRLDDESVKPLASYRAEELAGCGSISSGQTPPIMRPDGVSSSKGIRRRRRAGPLVPGRLEEPQTIFSPGQGSVILRNASRTVPRVNHVGLRP